jgi:hypothetical protein
MMPESSHKNWTGFKGGGGRSNPGALEIFLKEKSRIFCLIYATKITEDDENGL